MNLVPLASLLFLWLPFTDAASLLKTMPVEALEGIVAGASREQLANISLRLYTGDTIDEYTSVLIGEAEDLLDYIDSRKPTVFYISGWTETPETTSVVTVLNAYFDRGDHNVIMINWQHIAAQIYPFAAVSVKIIGETVAAALDEMVAAGLDASRIHIVGHSLGGQVAGAIGRNTKFTVPRIIGLDPAGPGYYIVVRALKYTDAAFVLAIHTDAGLLGAATEDGTANFWPNGGIRNQPGCPIIPTTEFVKEVGCSHARSWQFYAESLVNEKAFIGVSCKSYVLYRLGLCKSNPKVVMGYATPPTAYGNYYLETNGSPPYGEGKRGKSWDKLPF